MRMLIKAGRDLLGMTQAELCEKAGIPLITLRRIEGKPDHSGLVSQTTVQKVMAVLEAEGVQFLKQGQMAENVGAALRAIDYDATKRQPFGDWVPVFNETAAIVYLRDLWIFSPQGNGVDHVWVGCDTEQLVVIGEAILERGEWKLRTKKIVFKTMPRS